MTSTSESESCPSSAGERLLMAATLATMKRLGGDVLLVGADDRVRKLRGARVDNIMLQEWPADDARQKEIYCYWIEDEGPWKLDPSRLLYCLQWQHRGHPPDFCLQLVKEEPELWMGFVSLTLLAELKRHDPNLLDGLSLH